MLKLISRIPFYYFYRRTGWPELLPMNLTFSVTLRCNSKCKTCNIYKKTTEELSLEEWEKVFRNIGKNLFWATISGGEPFLRGDLPELICALYDQCCPSIINIPTNGILQERIPFVASKIADYCRHTSVVINVSIDGIGAEHDGIRGVSGNYDRALKTFKDLKKLKKPNLSIGIHTVISRFNVARLPVISEHLMSLNPDSYVTEIAEEREELGTIGADITPSAMDYALAVDFLSTHLKDSSFNRVGRLTRAFRTEYYQMVKKVLKEKRQVIPCYAGIASGHIAPNGNVWMCCVKAESAGNLRNFGYDLRKVWFSEDARAMRSRIKKGECYCPLANASYTNMLHHLNTLCRVGWNLAKANG
jgi:MoaA/NifB/PqqE/SkfB family radical SAM enzyme